MISLTDTVLESNKYLKINFNGGDLSSDAGLLLIKEFACKLGFINILKKVFKTNDRASFRYHKDDENLWQVIYQILGAYFEDDCADELTNDPILTAILSKEALTSQPTLSRFFNRMDESTLNQFYDLMRRFRKVVYSVRYPNMDSEPEKIVRFYCKRGTMENYIKESKNGFDFAAVSSSSKIVNANRLQIHALAYNIFNWFKRLALSASMRKQQINTIRLKLLKISAKVVHSARYITFKLCSSCPYKDEFYETLENIKGLQPKLE